MFGHTRTRPRFSSFRVAFTLYHEGMSDAILIDDTVAAGLLSMTPRRLARLARKGAVPCVILPDREVRFREVDLREWVNQHRRPSLAASQHHTVEDQP